MFLVFELDISRDEDHMKIKTQSERKILHCLSRFPLSRGKIIRAQVVSSPGQQVTTFLVSLAIAKAELSQQVLDFYLLL